jgi:hypothetical protein
VSRTGHLPDGACWCDGNDGVSQEDHSVYKHEHQDGAGCTRPWTALCQTQHGDLCLIAEHPTWREAMDALNAHMATGEHIAPGDGDTPTITPCALKEHP